MVPEALLKDASGRRGARLGGHGNNAARKTSGLEPALIDCAPIRLRSFELPDDQRAFTINVAGPAALFVAKLVKINERTSTPERLQPKDGLDILRILQATNSETLASKLRDLEANTLSSDVTCAAMSFLRQDGAAPEGVLATLAVQASRGLDDPRSVSGSMTALIEDLLDSYGGRG